MRVDNNMQRGGYQPGFGLKINPSRNYDDLVEFLSNRLHINPDGVGLNKYDVDSFVPSFMKEDTKVPKDEAAKIVNKFMNEIEKIGDNGTTIAFDELNMQGIPALVPSYNVFGDYGCYSALRHDFVFKVPYTLLKNGEQTAEASSETTLVSLGAMLEQISSDYEKFKNGTLMPQMKQTAGVFEGLKKFICELIGKS